MYFKNKLWQEVTWRLQGLHNARNAAVAALATHLYLDPNLSSFINLLSLSSFKGIKKRQECLYQSQFLSIYQDFAHHPTALKVTLESFRNRFPNHNLIACFEPRSNTICRAFHQKTLPHSLDIANQIYLGPVYRKEIYPKADCLNTELIANELYLKGLIAKSFQSNEELFFHLLKLFPFSMPSIIIFFTKENSIKKIKKGKM